MFARLLLSASAAVLFAGAAVVPRAETGSLTAAEADAVVGGRLMGYCCGYKSGCLGSLFVPDSCYSISEAACNGGKSEFLYGDNKACRSDAMTPFDAECNADAIYLCRSLKTCKWDPVRSRCWFDDEVDPVFIRGGNCGDGDAPCIEVAIIDILLPHLP